MRVSLLIPSGCVSTVPDAITAGGENFAQRVCGCSEHASMPQVLVDSLSIAADGRGRVGTALRYVAQYRPEGATYAVDHDNDDCDEGESQRNPGRGEALEDCPFVYA